MYALVENNEIKQIIRNPKSMVIGDVRYPAKIFQLWSASELNAIGIYEVITDSSNFKDEAYYNNTNEEYNFVENQATRSWGTATPKRLNDENAVDEDGENILDGYLTSPITIDLGLFINFVILLSSTNAYIF